jgi:hypothetical protein
MTTQPAEILCDICGLPVEGSMIGHGDGTGQEFAHPGCYYRERADKLERENKELRAIIRKPGPTVDPAAIIRQARAKAEAALLQVCGPEIQRICDAFVYDTGMPIHEVCFRFTDCTVIGGKYESVLVGAEITSKEVWK